MLNRKDRSENALFIPGSLKDYVPEDHILKRVNKVLDLSWLREEVADCYDHTNGRPGIDPEVAVRLMLAGFFHGIVHDRKLIREAEVNIAIRWFIGYDLTDKLPHHSSLTRIRQRWGMDRFRKIFEKTVEACMKAKLVNGNTVHIDATLIRADVSWESITTRHAETVYSENNPADEDDSDHPEPPKKRGRPRKHNKKPKKVSKTDPDATLCTANPKNRMEPNYKQHTTVDDQFGVVVDVELTTGEQSEGNKLIEIVDRIRETIGAELQFVTADLGYSHPLNYHHLESRNIDSVIPTKKQIRRQGPIPISRFKYNGKHNTVRCPGGKWLHRTRTKQPNGWDYASTVSQCQSCHLKARCLPPSMKKRTIRIVDGYEALTRARRRIAKGWDAERKDLYTRHKWRVEGAHGEAKTQHGLRRAVRRGLENVAIQMYLTAAVMNLKRLAAFSSNIFSINWVKNGRSGLIERSLRPIRGFA